MFNTPLCSHCRQRCNHVRVSLLTRKKEVGKVCRFELCSLLCLKAWIIYNDDELAEFCTLPRDRAPSDVAWPTEQEMAHNFVDFSLLKPRK